MSYKDKYGDTGIRNGLFHNLSINWEWTDDPNDLSQRRPILVFTPEKKKEEHYHIELSRNQAKILHEWLSEYLEETSSV